MKSPSRFGSAVPIALFALLLCAPVTAQRPCRPAPPGLVVWWDADDILFYPWHSHGPRAVDITHRISGPPLVLAAPDQATQQWSAPQIVPGRSGNAFLLTPGSPQLGSMRMSATDHPELDFTTAMTIELWMQDVGPPTGLPHYVLADKAAFGDTGYILFGFRAGGQVFFHIGQGSGRYSQVWSTTDLVDGNLHHVVATFDAAATVDNLKMYVDGQFESATTTNLPIVANNLDLKIGASGAATGGGVFRGIVDEFSLYDRALSAAEVLAAFNAPAKCRPMFPDRRWYSSVAVPANANLTAFAAANDRHDGNLIAIAVADLIQQTQREIQVHGRTTATSPWQLWHTIPTGSAIPTALSLEADVLAFTSGGVNIGPPFNTRGLYVYRFDGTTWNQEQFELINVTRSVCVDPVHGDAIAVGKASWYQTPEPEGVRVYRYVGTGWQLELSAGSSIDDMFGSAISLHGDLFAVGAHRSDEVGTDSGAVHIYRRDSAGVWRHALLITPDLLPLPSSRTNYDGFELGRHVSLDGDRLLVGALGAISPPPPGSYPNAAHGAAYVLDLSDVANGRFAIEGVLAPSSAGHSFAGDLTGRGVDLDGDLAVVAAGSDDESLYPSYAGTGAAYVFAKRSGIWTEVSRLRHGYAFQNGFFQDVFIHGGEVFGLRTVGAEVTVHTGLEAAINSFDPNVGAGCGSGSTPPPALELAPGSEPVIGEVFCARVSNLPPATPAAALLGFLPAAIDLGAIGAPGCIVRNSIDVAYGLANLGGTAEFCFQIPNDPNLVGFHFYVQVLGFDSAANVLGIVLSNGGVGRTGG